jgi:hypothetical protein
MPHIAVRCIDRTAFDYADIWQKRNLLLVVFDPTSDGERRREEDEWVAKLLSHGESLRIYDAMLVVTRDSIPGLSPASAVVADRWGEIAAIERGRDGALPPVEDLLEDLRFVAHACPECEGEWK